MIRLTFLILSILILLSCNSKTEESAIPEDVSYSIVDSDIVPDEKRALDMRLNKKVSEEVLREIALKLKSEDSGEYNRTFITYYLPDMEIGSGAWATTHFNPDLEIRILGMSLVSEADLSSSESDETREVIGRWLDDSFVSSRLVLFREDDILFMEQTFEDRSSRQMEVTVEEVSDGMKIQRIEESDFGDHWLINNNGNLEIRPESVS